MLNDFILIKDYCERCNIEPDFILMLEEDGLIDITVVGESRRPSTWSSYRVS